VIPRPRRLPTILYRVSRACLILAIGVNVFAFIGVIAAGDAWTGLRTLLSWFNPGNTRSFITEVLVFSPSVAAYLLAERLQGRE